MNKLIKDQLEKMGIPAINSHIFIPHKVGIKLEEDNIYLIKLSSLALNPPSNSAIVANWNQGRKPDSEYYKADVSKLMGSMMKINGLACDGQELSLGRVFNGWLNINEIEVLKKL